jgi:predicted small secreted protein
MMKFGRSVSAAVFVSALFLALSGCQKEEGPAERAGKEVDRTVEKAGEQVEKAGEAIQDAAKDDKK